MFKPLEKRISTFLGLILILAIAVSAILIIYLSPDSDEASVFKSPVKKGILVFSPQSNEEVVSPLRITGRVNGGGWTGFEGQVGLVELLDDQGGVLTTEILEATTDWMKPVIHFGAVLKFKSPGVGGGWLVFHNENPSGLEEKNKEFRLPIKFSSTLETTKIKVYFNNDRLDPEVSCNKVFPTEREIIKTPAIARAALGELLKGPTVEEKADGFFSNINSGVEIQGLVIENGVAKVDFDETLERAVGGSCRVAAIRSEITQTLKQFSTVKEVLISINGRTEDILQP